MGPPPPDCSLLMGVQGEILLGAMHNVGGRKLGSKSGSSSQRGGLGQAARTFRIFLVPTLSTSAPLRRLSSFW